MWPELPAQFANFSDNEGIKMMEKAEDKKFTRMQACKTTVARGGDINQSINQLTIRHDQFNSRASKEIDSGSTVHGGKAKCLFSPMY